jgi:hypothetical protein
MNIASAALPDIGIPVKITASAAITAITTVLDFIFFPLVYPAWPGNKPFVSKPAIIIIGWRGSGSCVRDAKTVFCRKRNKTQ